MHLLKSFNLVQVANRMWHDMPLLTLFKVSCDIKSADILYVIWTYFWFFYNNDISLLSNQEILQSISPLMRNYSLFKKKVFTVTTAVSEIKHATFQ
jgi:hypothetical protein